VASQSCWVRQLRIAALMLVAAIPLHAASLTCRCTDEQGKLLANVETRLTPAGTEDHHFQKSNKKGEAIFHGLTPGAFELRAQLKNHMPMKRAVQLSQDQTLELTLMTQDGFDAIDKQAADEINGAKFSKAAATLESLLKSYPLDGELHDHLARAYAGMGNEEKALAEAKQAAQLDPQFSDSPVAIGKAILLARGNKALEDHDFPKAAEAFEELVKLAPLDAKGYYGLALAYGHQNKYQQALPAIDKAVELDPQNDSYRKVKGILEVHATGH
jgi:tetratricopeptide (TPR) repeat protein